MSFSQGFFKTKTHGGSRLTKVVYGCGVLDLSAAADRPKVERDSGLSGLETSRQRPTTLKSNATPTSPGERDFEDHSISRMLLWAFGL